jgi:hypothetical protein
MTEEKEEMTAELYDELKHAYRRPRMLPRRLGHVHRLVPRYWQPSDYSWADGMSESDFMPDLGDK